MNSDRFVPVILKQEASSSYLHTRSCNEEKVAEIYRKLWHIELFFQDDKAESKKIKHLYGTSKDVVKPQIRIALMGQPSICVA